MKLSTVSALVFSALMSMAAAKRNYIVTFSDETPNSVVRDAAKRVENDGGKITHYYELIKGFAVEASEDAVSFVGTMDAKYGPKVEEDQEVHILDRDAPQ